MEILPLSPKTWASLRSVAPTVVAALTSPAGGAVAAAICRLFDSDASTVDASLSSASPEQIVELRKLEVDLIKQERELGFRYEQLVITDRASAREREAATGSSWLVGALAISTVVCFVAVITMILTGSVQIDSVLAGTLVGYVSAEYKQVLSYYFGSTAHSEQATRLLAASTPPSS